MRKALSVFILGAIVAYAPWSLHAGMCHLTLLEVHATKGGFFQQRADLRSDRDSISQGIRTQYPDAVMLFIKQGLDKNYRPANESIKRLSSASNLEQQSFFKTLDELFILNPTAAEKVVNNYWQNSIRPFSAMKLEAEKSLQKERESLALRQANLEIVKQDRLRGAEIVMSLLNPQNPDVSLNHMMRLAERSFLEASKNANSDVGRKMFEAAHQRIQKNMDPITSGESFRLMMNQTLGFSVASFNDGAWEQVVNQDNILGQNETNGAYGRSLVLRAYNEFNRFSNRSSLEDRVITAKEFLESHNLNHDSDRTVINDAVNLFEGMLEGDGSIQNRRLTSLISQETRN